MLIRARRRRHLTWFPVTATLGLMASAPVQGCFEEDQNLGDALDSGTQSTGHDSGATATTNDSGDTTRRDAGVKAPDDSGVPGNDAGRAPAVDAGTPADDSSTGGSLTDAGTYGRVLMLTNEGDGGSEYATWVFDGSQWTDVNTPFPSGASSPGTAGGKVWAYGGPTSGAGSTTYVMWRFDGASWTQENVPGPGGLFAESDSGDGFTYNNVSLNGVWIVGTRTETSVFDGVRWTHVQGGPGGGTPGTGSGNYWVAVPSLGKIVAYGGGGATDAGLPSGSCPMAPSTHCYATTWIFDVASRSWSLESASSPPGPAARGDWESAYAIGTTAVFAGQFNIDDGTNQLPSWSYDVPTATWTQIAFPNVILDYPYYVQYGPSELFIPPATLFNGTTSQTISFTDHPVVPTGVGVMAIMALNH